ncbi:hypothetical protein PVAND_013442 [Polypedilum vanderplanki]|uniref:PIN domain-containing protein n=1 Tax=Polypedilum vanderplanki TaxID=319348 RepID=A0A9J6CRK2_POLVA|nr:hypothetical protein PVAND_013442 [Polypedilum vanderplanki]
MDNYGSRGGNSNKYTLNKNQKSTYNNRRPVHDDEMYSERDRGGDDYYGRKPKKPEQNFYHQQKQQQQQHSDSSSSKRFETRPPSEPRILSNNINNNNFAPNQIDADRSRGDQRGGNKPPSVPRINANAAAFRNLPMNIDTLPPRLKRKCLKDAGLPEELAEKSLSEFVQQSSPYPTSNTLPYRNRYDQRYEQQQQYHQQNNNNYQSKYNQNQTYHHHHHNNNERGNSHHRSRSITPPPPRQQVQHQKHTPKNEWKSPNDKQHDDLMRNKVDSKDGSSFDWSEDVLQNSQSLPYDVNQSQLSGHKYEDNNRHRHRNRRRNRSASSNGSVERSSGGGYNPNDNNFQNAFKMPFPKSGNNNRQRRNSQSSYNSRENSMERSYGYNSRENSLDRRQNRGRRYQNRRGSDNYHSSRENSTERFGSNWSRHGSSNNLQQDDNLSWRKTDIDGPQMSSRTDQKIAELTKQFEHSVELNRNNNATEHKLLFDPKNPEKPILVTQSQSRTREFLVPDLNEHFNINDHQHYFSSAKPSWFKNSSEQYQKQIKSKSAIDELNRLDDELSRIIDSGELIEQWNQIYELREKIQKIFEVLLRNDMRFCQIEHVEHYFWKLLFYKIIEVLRNKMQDANEIERNIFKEKALEIVDTGTRYLESLLTHIEICHKFEIQDYIGDNAASYRSGLGYIGLALVSAQKIFLFLGDLARYREQINQTNNFGRAKNYYVKAQQIVPKNGRPFNQLALLAVYSKRKIDAVYFYMRSLMSSNPFLSAKESLVALFDEIRKKYEFSQRKREEKNRLRLKEKEHHHFDGNLRKETWVHPEGGVRVHRTAPLDLSMLGKRHDSSDDDEELEQLDPSELNKRFIISFLHVQGKLITKIGMESFQSCAIQMLKEFKALLHISPIPINSHRLLQLISLNIYAIDCNVTNSTELKDLTSGSDIQVRSEMQECAIIVALLMFGIIVDRFIEVLKETLNGDSGNKSNDVSVVKLGVDDHKNMDKSATIKDESKKILKLNEDSKVMLPAIKVFTDWMFYHENIWNPPPFPFPDYKIGATSNHDLWTGLAILMTLLETVVDANKDYLVLEKEEDCTLVRLLEDITMAGFTPLKKVTQDPIYCRSDINIEIAQNSLRLQKIKFFGTDFLCKCNPQPILKKIISSNGRIEYISVVQNRTGSATDSEILIESFSDEEENDNKKIEDGDINNEQEKNKSNVKISNNDNEEGDKDEIGKDKETTVDLKKNHNDAAEIRRLLRRKDELERKHKMQEKYNERLQDILAKSMVALHIEVRPRYLIPDTNCFIDDLNLIKSIANAYDSLHYQLMIPITVIAELEGLGRGNAKSLTSSSSSTSMPVSSSVMAPALCEKLEKISMHKNIKSGSRNDPQHVAMVTQACKNALAFLNSKHPAVKCVTTKGSIINATIFTSEDGPANEQKSNDDKILDTALSLCKKNVDEKRGDVRYIVREVVLLTNDRNLRVKALTNDIPVRELPDFIRWAGLGSDHDL